MRLWLSCAFGGSKAAEEILTNKASKDSPALINSTLATIQETKLFTVEEGEIDVERFEVPRERVERFVTRITKGLLTHYFPDYDYSTDTFDVRHVPQTVENLMKLDSVKHLLTHDFRGDGVFQYRMGLTDSKMTGIWIIVFYDAVLFLVVHSKLKLTNLTTEKEKGVSP